jgi:hypothetical protein
MPFLVPNSNGEDNRPARPVREFNTHHDHKGQFTTGASSSALTDTPTSVPRQPVLATSINPKTRGAMMRVIAVDPKGYDTDTVLAMGGTAFAKSVRSLIQDKAPVADHELRADLAAFQRAVGARQVEGAVAIQQGLASSGTFIAVGPIKSMHRAVEKAVSKFSGDIGQVRDMVRATIAVEHISDVPGALKALAAVGIKPVGPMENRFDTPTDLGYRDIKFNVRFPGSNVIGEIQVHTKAMLAAKEGLGHAYYEEARTIAGLRRTEQRTYTPAEKTRLTELTGLSKALYAKAYADSGGR